MPNLEWIESFELKVPEIDGDHRTMLDLMRAAQDAAATGDRPRCEHFMDRLLAFSIGHFAREEAFLESWGYPEVETHAKYHGELVERAKAVFSTCAQAETPEAYEECSEKMMAFLVEDVLRGDMKFKSFLENATLTLPV
jgi:hemerythrin